MKKIFALLAATVVLASASFAQTSKMKSDTTHKSTHKAVHHTMKKGDSTTKSKKPM